MKGSFSQKGSRMVNSARSRFVTSFTAMTILVGAFPLIIGGGFVGSFLILLTGAGLAALVASVLAGRMVNPLIRLIHAVQEVSEGRLSVDVGPIGSCEIGRLQNDFLRMVDAIRQKRMEAEDRLLHSETQASIGRLAAGVAHEINNPLTGVLTYTQLLLRRKDLSDDVRSDLQTVAQATERIRKIVRGLLDFSRQTKLNPQPTDLNGIAFLSIPLMRHQAVVKGVDVKFKPAPNLPMLTLDRSQFQSVLLNILLNALDATGPGGRIMVSTCLSESPDHQGKKGVAIAFEDTGCGIPAEYMGKLFDPFFTTKEIGHGTGLGLPVSLGIVQRHGGTIHVKSEVGKGSTFTIWLPVETKVDQKGSDGWPDGDGGILRGSGL
jgi:two-component system NtrC family sensor kinase